MTRRYTGGFISAKEQATDANSANGIFTLQEANALTTSGSFPTGSWTPQRSLRFRQSANAYVERRRFSAPTNNKKWTFSAWVKRGMYTNGANNQYLLNANTTTGDGIVIDPTSETFGIFFSNGTPLLAGGKVRDFSAWYHVVFAIDTTQAVSTDRVSIYINGVKQTLSAGTYPSLNADTFINRQILHRLGAPTDPSVNGQYFDGYMSNVNFIDGQTLAASDFGMTDPQTGSWIPKRYTGTYGNNGFFLEFSDTSSTNSTNGGTPSGNVTYNVGLGNQTTICTDRPIPNGTTVSSIGVYLNSVDSGKYVYIVQANGSNSYTVVASSNQWQHYGDGLQQVQLTSPYTIPATGTYYVAVYTPNSGLQWGQDTGAGTNVSYYVGTVSGTFTATVANTGYKAAAIVWSLNNGIAKDSSPNLQTFTTVNVSLSSGNTYDSMVDIPGLPAIAVQSDVGGVQRGNYATLSPLTANVSGTVVAGGLKLSQGSAAHAYAQSSMTLDIPVYAEAIVSSSCSANVACAFNIQDASLPSTGTRAFGYYSNATGTVSNNGTDVFYTSAFVANDVIQYAYDPATGYLWLGKNNVWFNSTGGTTSPPSATSVPTAILPKNIKYVFNVNAYANAIDVNFGQRPFAYTPPAGFKTLNTTNLPNPVIKRPSEQFQVSTWVGNGNTLNVGAVVKQTDSVVVSQSLKTKGYGNLVRTIRTEGDRKKWTWSAWVKRSELNSRQVLLGSQSSTATTDNTTNTFLEFGSDNKLTLDGHTLLWRQSNMTFTDTAQWHHIVVSVDTTHSSAANRIRIYWDGAEINSWATYNNPAQNSNLGINQVGKQWIGAMDASMQFNGGLAFVAFVEGQQLPATSFGAFDSSNNWVPQSYSGTYGTNGYMLDMSRPGIGNKSYALTLNGSTNRVTIPSSANLAFGTGDFTIEFNQMFGSFGASNGSGFAVFYEGRPVSTQGAYPCIYTMGAAQTLIWFVNGADRITSPRLSTGVFYHIAISRVSGTTRMFIDGNLVGSWADTTNYLQAPVVFGNGYGGLSSFLAPAEGHTTNLRVVKGTGLYTTNFTAPTEELTAVSGTQLLTFKSSTFTDYSSNNFTVTPVAGAHMLITYPYQQKPICAANFNAAEVYTVTTGSGAFAFGTGDYTIEAWIYLRTYSADVRTFFESGLTFDVYTQANCNVNPDGTVNLSGTGPNTTNTVQLNCWNHVAYSRTAGVQKIFINGIEGASWSNTANYTSNGCKIGTRNNNAQNYGLWDGYISDLRVVKGTGLYTSNFIPPTTKLTAVAGTQLLALQDSVPVDKSSNGFTLVASGSSYPFVDSRVMRPNSEMFGYDSSGNNNHFGGVFNMMHNFLTMNASTDVPTNSSISNGEDTGRMIRGSYAVVDKNRSHTYTTVGYSGLYVVGTNDTNSNFQASPSTLSVSSGKWYVEYFINSFASSGNSMQFGVSSYDWMSAGANGNQNGYAVGCTMINTDNATAANRDITVDGVLTTLAGGGSGVTWYPYDCVGIALDADAKKVYFYKNGVLLNSVGANITVLPNSRIWFYGFTRYYGSASSYAVNFGDTPFRFAPPSGYKSLNSKNLRDVGSNDLPDTFGNYVNTPDLVWIKNRSGANNHILQDTVRGTGVYVDITTSAQSSLTTGVQAFNPSGYTVGSISGANTAGNNHVGWAWNRSKTPGFDIVSYAAPGGTTPFYVDHNLGVKPAFVVTKSTSRTTGANWYVWHQAFGDTESILLNTTAAKSAYANSWANGHTSTQLGLGSNITQYSGEAHVAYVWAEVAGFSKFGSYTGNGSADGPFINCGFRPRWIMIKCSSAIQDWKIIDTARNPVNPATSLLGANIAAVEDTNSVYDFDIVSNGFKIRNTYGYDNTSTATYIYAAFAEAPFKYANAR